MKYVWLGIRIIISELISYIQFFLLCFLADHDIKRPTEPDFWKKKKKNDGPNLGQMDQNRAQN